MLRSLAALLLPGLASAVAQDNYPSRQNTLIAPFAAGGSTDLVGRNSVSQYPGGYMCCFATAGATVHVLLLAVCRMTLPIILQRRSWCHDIFSQFQHVHCG
jgi:hypothetical protein